jgi:hypothetical protein
MAAIAQIATWRIRDGRLQDFMATVASAKKIHARLGAKIRVWQSLFGGEGITVEYSVEHSGWEAFGLFGAKLEGDADWQKLWAKALENPTADLIQNKVVGEAPGI